MAIACRADNGNLLRTNRYLESRRHFNKHSTLTCYVTQPDTIVLHIEVGSKAVGKDVMNKVCTTLRVMDEGEYFGLQYALSNGDLIWLNMRNRLSRQLPGSPPYHLYFKVKYFVPPHTLVLEDTRHQFYLNVTQQLKLGLWDAECSIELQARLIALMAYVQFGPYNPATTPCKYACFWADQRGEISHDLIRLAATFHKEYADMTVVHAEYELIRIAQADVPAYGVYFYKIRDVFDRHLLMGVGPEFVAICGPDLSFVEKFPYCRLKTVTMAARVLTLSLLEDDGSSKEHNYQLPDSRIANSLYRTITEMHCFFRCDNVRDFVLSQTNQNFNNSLASIFDYNDREYTFDVHLTCREVYDRVRRRIFHTAAELSNVSPNNLVIPPALMVAAENGGTGDSTAVDPLSPYYCGFNRQPSETANSQHSSGVSSEEVEEVIQERLREATKCRLCMDRNITRVFLPCGHVMCCGACADRVEECPICRKEIEMRHPCFLPWDDVSKATVPINHFQRAFCRRHNDSMQSNASSSLPENKVSFGLSFDSNTQSMPSLQSTPGSQPSSCSPPNQLPTSPPQDTQRATSDVEIHDSTQTTTDCPRQTRPLRSVAFADQNNASPVSLGSDRRYSQHSGFNFFHRRRHRSSCTSEASTSGAIDAS